MSPKRTFQNALRSPGVLQNNVHFIATFVVSGISNDVADICRERLQITI